jgi:hypothetical protein
VKRFLNGHFKTYIALKKKVAASEKFAEMSKNFIMVNSEVRIIKI